MEKIGNIGASTRRELEKFANLVLKDFVGWKMKWTTCGGICIHKRKMICVDERFIGKVVWEAKEHVLHEIAHIDTWPEDMLHGIKFYSEYIRLLNKFMVKDERRCKCKERPLGHSAGTLLDGTDLIICNQCKGIVYKGGTRWK